MIRPTKMNTQRRASLVCLLLLVAAGLLSACSLSEDLNKGLESRQAVQQDLEKKHGLSGIVGFTYSNGRLTSVTVMFDQDQVTGTLAEELVSEVKPVVVRHFKETPEELSIIISVSK